MLVMAVHASDINPIRGISKTDLKKFITCGENVFDLPILRGFLDVTPTAELEPISETHMQPDEATHINVHIWKPD
ncbi:hypothetical protein JVU11DRAFT_12717 [Chiua virens]|nr:hypothetical protein JVU11DRAFT_12717 [Chiua virens]